MGRYWVKKGAVRLGPTRFWIHAETLRSTRTAYATAVITTPKTTPIFSALKRIICAVGLR